MKLKNLTNGYIFGGTNILLVSTSPDEILFKGKMEDLRYCYRRKFKQLRNQKVLVLRDHWEDETNYLVIQIEKPENFKPIISDFNLEKTLEIEVTILKYPTEKELLWCKQCTLNTVGKTSTKLPDNEWIEKLVKAEHSPIRELWFGIKMEIPYWVSVH